MKGNILPVKPRLPGIMPLDDETSEELEIGVLKTIKPYLVFAKAFGVLPVKNVFKKVQSFPEFKFKYVFEWLWSLFLLLAFLAVSVFQGVNDVYAIAEKTGTAAWLSAASDFWGCIIMLLGKMSFLFAICRFCRLLHDFGRTDRYLATMILKPEGKLSPITIIVSCLYVFFTALSGLFIDSNYKVTIAGDHLAVFIILSDISGIFPVILFFAVADCIYTRFQCINQKIIDLPKTPRNMDKTDIETTRITYNSICCLIESTNSVFGFYFLFVFLEYFVITAINAFLSVLLFSQVAYGADGIMTQAFSHTETVLCAFIPAAMICFMAARVTDQASASYNALQEAKLVTIRDDCKEQIFQLQRCVVSRSKVSFEAAGFFTINTRSITVLVAVITTYVIILMQFSIGGLKTMS